MVLGERAVATLPRSPMQQLKASVDPGDSTSATPKRNKSYRGYLHKRSSGAIKRWQKRYFTLEQRRLHYYNGENECKTSLHTDSIHNISVTQTDAGNALKIVIGHSHNRTLQLKATDVYEGEEFVKVLRAVAEQNRPPQQAVQPPP